MIKAADIKSSLVLRMRPAGCSGSSSGSPRTSGITLTPSRSQRCQELA